MENVFTERDLEQIKNKGISIEKIEKQLYFYKNGIPKIVLQNPATIENGIVKLSAEEKEKFISVFEEKKNRIRH